MFPKNSDLEKLTSVGKEALPLAMMKIGYKTLTLPVKLKTTLLLLLKKE
ncbi:MAG: hypothetical protein HYY61_01550 [Deltaproteobacteria bacterium]|nr:hypothetical protein [Deltaproteobacteria bacterium]